MRYRYSQVKVSDYPSGQLSSLSNRVCRIDISGLGVHRLKTPDAMLVGRAYRNGVNIYWPDSQFRVTRGMVTRKEESVGAIADCQGNKFIGRGIRVREIIRDTCRVFPAWAARSIVAVADIREPIVEEVLGAGGESSGLGDRGHFYKRVNMEGFNLTIHGGGQLMAISGGLYRNYESREYSQAVQAF